MADQHSVRDHLGTAPQEYDRKIRVLVPGYERMLSTIGWWLSQIVPEHGRIVELGGGTGALAESVLQQLPSVRMEIWDVDREMLVVARGRLRDFGDRVVLRERSFTEPLDRCDAVIATLALHHISVLDAKRAVYANVFAALSPRGIFLNGDCAMDLTEPARTISLQNWLDFMSKHGIGETEGRQHLADWAKEDSYQQIFDELSILSKAGFPRPEIYWREGPMAVYGGLKL